MALRTLEDVDTGALTTTKASQYGAVYVANDGTVWRYVGFGGTSTIAPGQLCVAAPYVANYYNLVITATTVAATPQVQTTASLSAGSNYLVLTNGSTAITQDQFVEGYLEVIQTSGTNNGPQRYKITGNTAAAASTGYVTVFIENLANASVLVPGTDTASLYASPYSAVAPSATLGRSIGVTAQQIVNTSTVTNYGWVISQGNVLLTNDAGGNLTVAEGIAQSSTTAGNVVAVAATTYQIGQTEKAFNASTSGPCVINLP